MDIDKKPEATADDSTPSGLNFMKDGVVYIYGTFNDSIAKEVIPDLLKEVAKQKALKDGKIKIYIDSNGGTTRYLYNLLAILEDAKKGGVIIETYVFGYAYSCGSILACAGTKGYRYVSYLAEHCAHLGAGGLIAINDTELERSSARVRAHFDRVRDLYRKYADIKDLESAIKFDNYYIRGGDIITNGLADKFID